MFDDRFWWPLDLSEREAQACEDFAARMRSAPPVLDLEAVRSVSGQLARLMAHHAGDVVERDGLPHLCHLVNGWGDGRFRGQRLLSRLEGFVHRDAAGRPV
ncbi:MAG TPA: hypothetical protein VJ725_25805, partial [Thermoanaerobaculia bacterium]|nr:hypothetical protein [Thermoanaerobaculia bacterium]